MSTKNIAKASCAKCKISFVCYMPDDECQDCGGKLTRVRWARFAKPEDFLRGCELVLQAENYHGQSSMPLTLYRRLMGLVSTDQGIRLELARRIAETLMP